MNLKIAGLGVFLFIAAFSGGMVFASSKSDSDVPSSFVYQAINKYKQKNYTACIQDMDYAISHGKATDVVYYYKALSYAQLGMEQEAKQAYERAKSISKNQALIEYSTQALSCIDEPSTCDTNLGSEDITTFIKSENFMHNDVSKALQDKSIEKAKNEINGGKKPAHDTLKYLNSNDIEPSDKEIADAMRTLAKLGINPFMQGYANPMLYGQNMEMAQLSSLFSNQNNNNSMLNLIPMITSMQSSGTSSDVNKELVQAMMMNQMLTGFNFGSSEK